MDLSAPILVEVLLRADSPSRNSTAGAQGSGGKGGGFGYVPTLGLCYLFIALFSLSTACHIIQTIRYRTWVLISTVLFGLALEILGWSARMLAAKDPGNRNANIIQFTSLIVAPTPILAANFVTIGRIIRQLGEPFSRLKPRMYTVLFLSADIIALLTQAIGGYMAGSAATGKISRSKLKPGSDLVLAGITFQLAVIVFFALLSGEFLWRYRAKMPVSRNARIPAPGETTAITKRVIFAVAFNTICLLIRAAYRTAELADGWGGAIMSTEWIFNVFDAGMIVLAVYSLNFGHQGLLTAEQRRKESQIELQAR